MHMYSYIKIYKSLLKIAFAAITNFSSSKTEILERNELGYFGASQLAHGQKRG